MKKMLLLLPLPLAFAASAAADWELVHEDSSQAIYLDKATLEFNGRITKAWRRVDYSSPRTASSGSGETTLYTSAKDLLELDCARREYRFLSTIMYSEKGEVVESANGATPFAAVVPDTYGEAFFKAACAQRPAGKSRGKP